MPRIRSARPYLDTWLRRLSRELSGSGSLAQMAQRLSLDLGDTPEAWKGTLTAILAGHAKPSMDLVTHLDAIWSMSGSSTSPAPAGDQGSLFESIPTLRDIHTQP